MEAKRKSGSLFYSIFPYSAGEAMSMLKSVFPNAKADELNFCLFSTGGVYGTYSTIEDAEIEISKGESAEITFLVIHPRVVALRYGNVIAESQEDIDFLRRLRANSLKAVRGIGIPNFLESGQDIP